MSGRRKLLVWDSCGPHRVPAVAHVLAEWGVASEPLPVNLTDELQVMDLVVNGPLKAHMRYFRCAALYNYFQGWRAAREADAEAPGADAGGAGAGVVPFAPPKPTLLDGLNVLQTVSAGVFSSPAFKAGLVRAFVSVGLAVGGPEVGGGFARYESGSRGVLPARPTAVGVGV